MSNEIDSVQETFTIIFTIFYNFYIFTMLKYVCVCVRECVKLLIVVFDFQNCWPEASEVTVHTEM